MINEDFNLSQVDRLIKMNLLINTLNILLSLLYGASIIFYGLHFFRSSHWAKKYMSRLLQMTALLHLGFLTLRGFYYHYFPSANIYEMATVVALAITLIYLFIEYRLKIHSTGFFILIVVFLLQIFSSIFITFEKTLPEILRSPFFILHTSTVILSYAALFVSTLYGIMYLLLFHDLKSAQFGVIYSKMPSLEELSEMNVRAAIIGFLFLTLTIFFGIIWRNRVLPEVKHFDPQVIGAYLVWMIYGLMIYGKKIGQWTGKGLAYVSIGGFMVIILSVIVVKMITRSFHQFG